MPTTEKTLAMIKEVFAAFNDHDVDRFRALLADDAILDIGGSGQLVHGVEPIVAAVSQTLIAIPDLRVTVTNAFAQRTSGVAEVVREGTHTGTVSLPDGTAVPPTHRPVRLPECAVFQVHEEKIVRMAVYADQRSTHQQLGLLPG